MVYNFKSIEEVQQEFEVKEGIAKAAEKIIKVFRDASLECRILPMHHGQVQIEATEKDKGLEIEILSEDLLSYLLYQDTYRFSEEAERLPLSQELIMTLIEKYRFL